MDITLVLTTGEGGMPHYTAELANSFTSSHNISVIKPSETTAEGLFKNNVSTYDWFENTGISWSRITSFDINPAQVIRGILSYRATGRINEINPDVVHFTHQPHPYLRPIINTDHIGVPVIQTRHEIFMSDHWFKIPGRDLPAEYNFLSAHTIAMIIDNFLRKAISEVEADGYIVHTEQNRRELDSFKSGSRIAIIPHGAFSVFGSSEGNADGERNTILYFGDLRGNKDIQQLVDAGLQVREQIDDLTVIIAGSGTVKQSVNKKIESNPDLFTFINKYIPNEEVEKLFSSAQVVVIPHKRQNGHSGTMTIAFAHGKPIVATNVGEYDELVRGNGAGFIVEPEDSDAMAIAIQSLLQNDGVRGKMSENSNNVGEMLSWENVAVETISFYQDCINSSIN